MAEKRSQKVDERHVGLPLFRVNSPLARIGFSEHVRAASPVLQGPGTTADITRHRLQGKTPLSYNSPHFK